MRIGGRAVSGLMEYQYEIWKAAGSLGNKSTPPHVSSSLDEECWIESLRVQRIERWRISFFAGLLLLMLGGSTEV